MVGTDRQTSRRRCSSSPQTITPTKFSRSHQDAPDPHRPARQGAGLCAACLLNMPCDRSNKTFLRRNLIYVIISKDGARFCRQNAQNKRKRPHCRFFVHVVEKGSAGYNTSVQPHSCIDYKCIFCGFDAASLTGVWCHFHSNHGHLFDFSYRVTMDWKVCVICLSN